MLTADQFRRQVRRELHAARCRDGDQGGPRYWRDALELDRRMAEAGYPLNYQTQWGLGNGPKTPPEVPPVDFQPSGDRSVP